MLPQDTIRTSKIRRSTLEATYNQRLFDTGASAYASIFDTVYPIEDVVFHQTRNYFVYSTTEDGESVRLELPGWTPVTVCEPEMTDAERLRLAERFVQSTPREAVDALLELLEAAQHLPTEEVRRLVTEWQDRFGI